ncbi:ATP-binding protein [Actinoplanes sp. CA-131856]
MLLGRAAERAVLDRLVSEVRSGESRALVMGGRPGVGKTALLDHVAEQAAGCSVLRVSGVKPEQHLAYAALHQICRPLIDLVEALPAPQRTALSIAFGFIEGGAPDQFLVGLGVLSILADLAQRTPVVCLIDDAQWLDTASAQVVGFVARRLRTGFVGFVIAVRNGDDVESPDLIGIPNLPVTGLPHDAARALLTSAYQGSGDKQVLDRLIGESGGNPRMLLALSRSYVSAELAGGFGLLDASSLPPDVEEAYRRRVAGLPPDAQQMLLVAATEPTGDPGVVWRALDRFGIEAHTDLPFLLAAAGLVDFSAGIRFQHPLLRSVVYRTVGPDARRAAHNAVAEAIDGVKDPDRQAWHRALAARGRDAELADLLEDCAAGAKARGGSAAAAAFLERAGLLTPDPDRRGRRLLAAAQAMHDGGMPRSALRLVAMADANAASPPVRAQAALLEAHVADVIDGSGNSLGLLLRAAARLEQMDPSLAVTTYLEAFRAAWYAAGPSGSVSLASVAKAARSASELVQPPRPVDLLLRGLVLRYTDGLAAGVDDLRAAQYALLRSMPLAGDALRWLWFMCATALDLCDDPTADALTREYVRIGRDDGAAGLLPMIHAQRIVVLLFAGELAEAGALVDEMSSLAEEASVRVRSSAALMVAAWSGDEERMRGLVTSGGAHADRRGDGLLAIHTKWSEAVFLNGLRQFDEALAAAERATSVTQELGMMTWAPLVELVVAAAHAGKPETGRVALRRLAAMTEACDTDWARGMERCCRALLDDESTAEYAYVEAIERLSRTRAEVYLARTRLYFGEWLWRHDRRADARDQLRIAHEQFSAMGMAAYAKLAETRLERGAVRRSHSSPDNLTEQEQLIVRLTRDGLSNADIAARLFISHRTVEWHLSKVFNKLGISSRRQLRRPSLSS